MGSLFCTAGTKFFHVIASVRLSGMKKLINASAISLKISIKVPLNRLFLRRIWRYLWEKKFYKFLCRISSFYRSSHRRCSAKQVFLKISQQSQENICVAVFLKAFRFAVLLIKLVELLGIQLDNKLNFSLHISNICKSAASQLNALLRLQKFLSFKEKKILISSYFMAKFNYCPLVWMFSNAVSLKKIENLQKWALRFLQKSYNTSYEDLLLKSGFSSMNVNRLRTRLLKLSKLWII